MDEFIWTVEKDIIPWCNIWLTDNYKMKLYEAYFSEEYCNIFMQRNESLSRTQLDAQNSDIHAVRPYHKFSCDK